MAKLSADGGTLIYSTSLRGRCDSLIPASDFGDYVNESLGIVVDGSGYAYVVGAEVEYNSAPSMSGPGWYASSCRAFAKKLCPGKIFSIKLSSEAGPDNQTVCVNTPIRAIQYFMSGASKAKAVGLPPEVSITLSGGIATIEGKPTRAGTFSHTVMTENGCGSATGTITVRPNTAITLTSASGTDMQKVCVNTAITPITYTITKATGVEVKGLPAGVTSRFENGTLNISSTPTDVGTFSYTVTPVGGCGNAEAKGSINVRPNTTAITLTSSPRIASQKVRVNKPIKPITYSVTDATGAEAKGLPPGVTGTYAGGVFTISGTPTAAGVFSYEVLPVGGCRDVKGTSVITVKP